MGFGFGFWRIWVWGTQISGAPPPNPRWIPRASLAAVIMCAVVHMIDLQLVVTLWRACKKDFVVWVVTFCSSIVWGVEFGVIVGAALDMVTLLVGVARPKVKVLLGRTVSRDNYSF